MKQFSIEKHEAFVRKVVRWFKPGGEGLLEISEDPVYKEFLKQSYIEEKGL